MYTHISKCKNDKIKERKKKFLSALRREVSSLDVLGPLHKCFRKSG
jgi:hypothetical protein